MDQVCTLALPAEQEQVLMRLAQRASDDGTHCYPSVDELARSTGRTERTVQRALRALQAAGHIQVLAYPHGGRGHATEWLVCPQLNGDIRGVKGDTSDTLLDEERVTPVAERVTPTTERVTPVVVKGDTGVTPVDQEKIKKRSEKRSEGAARPAHLPIDESFISQMVAKYADRLGGEGRVRAAVEAALNHTASRKWIDKRRGVDDWLRRDAERVPVLNGRANGHGPPVLSAAAQRFQGVSSPFPEIPP